MNSNSPNNRAGFTLMEILIVIAILAFISLGIYQATVQTFTIRDSIQREGEFYNGIHLVMGIVERDIAQMYTPLIMIQNGPAPAPSGTPAGAARPSPTPSNQPQISSGASADLEHDGTYWAAALDNSGLRPSRFQGSDKSISFISASHVRMYKDMPEADLVKITYEFKTDSSPPEGTKLDSPSMLSKTENVDAFENDEFKDKQYGVVYPLLHGITKFKFGFYDKRKEKWETSWDSEKVDNLFPDIIRVEFEVHGPSNMSFEGSYYFRPEAPLNGLNPSS
jgi:prepilin-type N-terminal cleavage/methylation domain-containing protein